MEAQASTCLIRIGDTRVGLLLSSPAYAESVRAYFGVAGSHEAPDVLLHVNVIVHDGTPRVPSSLFTAKTFTPDGFSVADGLVRGTFSPETMEGRIDVNCVLTKGQTTRIFEQIVYQAYYSAQKRSREDAFLMHSAGVLRGEDGFLFVGASGAGKTTAARSSPGRRVLNDEICLVRFAGQGASLHWTPFNGHFREKREGAGTLRCVLLLAHGSTNRLLPVSKANAIACVAAQIVPPVGLEGMLDTHARTRMLDLAERLVRRVPVRRLEFLPDPRFWSEIDREFCDGGEGR